MSETKTIELNKAERELLLRGLRFIRSSILLDPHLPSDEDDARREQEIENVEQLMSTLQGAAGGKAQRVSR